MDRLPTSGSPGPAANAPALERLGLGDTRWRQFVASHRDALPCHDPGWASLLADCYSLEPFVLASLDEAGEIRAGLPLIATGGRLRRRVWVSLPFTDFCPPLLGAQMSAATLAGSLDAARRVGGAASIEVRAPLAPAAPPPAVGFRHLVELADDPQVAFERFHHSQVQRAIRRLERDRELEVRVASSPAELSDVYYRLHLDTRRRLGMPVQPRRFFTMLWERMIEPGLGFLLLAYAGRRAVAGAVFLRSQNTLLYKYSASEPDAWRLRPNHLIIWSAIQRACGEGQRWLDFGRTELAHAGLRAFKLSWGASEEPLIYTCLSEGGSSGAGVGSHELLAATIRHSPRLLCRLTGELLYRYAA
jgi:CelD/BcsL family acetyltransferase involved in cellulose biosynthesis